MYIVRYNVLYIRTVIPSASGRWPNSELIPHIRITDGGPGGQSVYELMNWPGPGDNIWENIRKKCQVETGKLAGVSRTIFKSKVDGHIYR